MVIIVSCYNEEDVLFEAAKILSGKLSRLISDGIVSEKSGLLFIDDGSSDSTWALIEKCRSENPLVLKGIKLAKNCGQPKALLCGLLSVKDYADIAITVDADLQGHEDAIDSMLDCYFSGAEIVLGIRTTRGTDSLFRKWGACAFYSAMRFFGANLIKNHAYFRLVNRKAIKTLAESSLKNPFLRGNITRLGCKTALVNYKIKNRFAGKSKYTFRKLFALAAEEIASCLRHEL